jgi:hypothetical protein
LKYQGGGAFRYGKTIDIRNLSPGLTKFYISIATANMFGGTITMTRPEVIIKSKYGAYFKPRRKDYKKFTYR